MGKMVRRLEPWLQWIIVTAVGWPVAILLSSGLLGALRIGPAGEPSLVFIGAMGGFLLAFGQYLIIGGRARGLLAWLLATTLGWTLGIVVADWTIRLSGSAWGWVAGGAAGGLLSGLIQSLALASGVPKKTDWLVQSGASWTAAYALGIGLVRDILPSAPAEGVLTFTSPAVFGWGMVGLIATVLLVTTVPRAEPKDKSVPIHWLPDIPREV